jgi:hypothetical protein
MEWVNQRPDPGWGVLPLTHITRGVIAEDIIRESHVRTSDCPVFGEPLAYFFYGRPAYRIGREIVIKAEALCPYCFIFKPELLDRAKSVFAFDTGAFNARLFSGVIASEMEVNDFRLEGKSAPNRLIALVFGSQQAYLVGDTRVVSAKANPHEFHAKAYLDLLLSPGRNEPDDRVFSIEVIFGDSVGLSGLLMAVVLPHTLWSNGVKAPWLGSLADTGAEIIPYEFIPGRAPEHYHTLMEMAVKDFYERSGILTCRHY